MNTWMGLLGQPASDLYAIQRYNETVGQSGPIGTEPGYVLFVSVLYSLNGAPRLYTLLAVDDLRYIASSLGRMLLVHSCASSVPPSDRKCHSDHDNDVRLCTHIGLIAENILAPSLHRTEW